MKRKIELKLGETIYTGQYSGVRVDYGASLEYDDEELIAGNLTPGRLKEALITEVRAEFLKQRKQKLAEHYALNEEELHEKQNY
jgi:hypothetical protein